MRDRITDKDKMESDFRGSQPSLTVFQSVMYLDSVS